MRQKTEKSFFKKRSKRAAAWLLALAALFLLGACSKKQTEQVSLYDQGMAIVGLMEEIVGNEAYGAMMTGSQEIAELAGQLAAGDYTKPSAVYELAFPPMKDMMARYGETDMLDGLSDDLQQYLNDRLQSALITQFNALGGTEVLAATSVYTVGRTFVSEELEENKVYIYTFSDGYPIAVTFVAGEEHSVSASGSFLMAGEKEASFEEIEEAMQSLFGENCTIQKLELP